MSDPSDPKIYPVPAAMQQAHLTKNDFESLYRRSIEDKESFFAEMAEQFLDWNKPWHSVCHFDFAAGETSWFAGAELNVSVNCIDRH